MKLLVQLVALCVSVLIVCSSSHQLLASAETIVVADVDGTIEDFAAITTILQHPDYTNALRLISVSGVSWGYGSSVVRNLCQFVALSWHSGVSVALGQISATVDAYDTTTQRGGCSLSQGFPATPHDAAARGMLYSKTDVTAAYGAVYLLPKAAAPNAACDATIGAATTNFMSLLRQLSTTDRLVYLQLGAATNLASIIAAVHNQNSPSLKDKFYSIVEVHAFETGYNSGADAVAMDTVLSVSKMRVVLYPPAFYNPSATFNFDSWQRFGSIAQEASTPNDAAPSSPVAWLHEAWSRKKALMDKANNMAFFKERGPASSLMTLCALDLTLRSKCHRYRTAVDSILVASRKPAATTGYVVAAAGGNNVTMPMYYQAHVSATGADDGAASSNSYVYTKPASEAAGAGSTALITDFWALWETLLRL